MKLSDRLRSGSECAPWVLEEVKRLENDLELAEDDVARAADTAFDSVKMRDQLAIANGRLRKRIAKLTEQRDSARETLEHYHEVLSRSPFIMRREEDYQRRRAEEARVRALDKRVYEQELLIQRLLKEFDNVRQANPDQ